MGKKYIIELLDDCNSEFKGIMVFGLTQEKQIAVELIQEDSLTPYTEPDMEQVRKEAYDKGYTDAAYNCHERCAFLDDEKQESYRCGLRDAWEAARKVTQVRKYGGYGDCLGDVFGRTDTPWDVFDYSASEAIEKIRQYEREQEEIKVGDEITDGVANLIVLEINQDGTVSGFDDEGSIIHATPRKKTGRHFAEIATALQKMKES